ncbi:hypothetical protein Ancab_002432, partial [Ancistrocladus abbreviatus]
MRFDQPLKVQAISKSVSQSAIGGNKLVSYVEVVKTKYNHKWNTQHNKEAEVRIHARRNGGSKMSVEVKEEEYAWLKKCYVGRWGEVLEIDEDTIAQRKLDIAKVKVTTSVTEFISCPVNVEINGHLFRIKIIKELCVTPHHLPSSPSNCEEDDNSCQVRKTTGSKNFEGPDAGSGNNLKSTNGSQGDFIGEEDNEGFCNDKNMKIEKMAQDKLRGDSTGSRHEISLGMGPKTNRELEAEAALAASFGLRSVIHRGKGQDECCIIEAQIALQKESGSNNLGFGLGISMVPWYFLETQPTVKDPPSPKISHVSQTPPSSPSSDSRRKHKQTPTKETSLYRATHNNIDADLDESLAVFTKRLKSKKGNSIRKKKSMHPTQRNLSLSPSGENLWQGQEGDDVARTIARSPSHNDPLM